MHCVCVKFSKASKNQKICAKVAQNGLGACALGQVDFNLVFEY